MTKMQTQDSETICDESPSPKRKFIYQQNYNMPAEDNSQSDGEESVNPIVDAFLKIGAIAEERRELLINSLSCMNNKLVKENRKIMKLIQRQEDTICSLWQKLKSSGEVNSETYEIILSQNTKLQSMVEQLKSENDTLRRQQEPLRAEYKEMYCKLEELKRAYRLLVEKGKQVEKGMSPSERQGILIEECQEIEAEKNRIGNDLKRALETLEIKNSELSQLKEDLNVALQAMDGKDNEVTSLREEKERLLIEKEKIADILKQENDRNCEQTREMDQMVVQMNQLKSKIDGHDISKTAAVKFYEEQIQILEDNLQSSIDELNAVKKELDDRTQCEEQLLQRIKKLNFQILFHTENEKDLKDKINTLERDIADMEGEMKCEIEKYLKEISCLKQKIWKMKNIMKVTSMVSSECSIKFCEEENIKASDTAGTVENLIPTGSVEKVYSTIIEKLTQEQIKSHTLVDRLHNYRLQFVMTQKEISKLRKKCNDGCNKIAIWARVVKEQLLTEDICDAEKEWKNSVAQTRALLNALTLLHKADTESNKSQQTK